VTKKATVADITNPLTNDGVYITPLWLQEYQSDGRGFINASFTTSSATFQDDLAAAIAPCIIKATSNIIGTVDGIEYSLVPGDILYKTLNISGSAEYSIILQSYTQFLNALSSPFSIPLSICSPGKIITVYNSTTNNITVNLDSSLSVITGGQSFNLPGNSTITLTRVINTNTMVITGLLGPVLTNLL
jgi:hypothetical protein